MTRGALFQSGLQFVEVLCKNRYVGRTFIQPNNRLRKLGVAMKFGALSENVSGRRLVLIDDSIVRGNTIGPIIKLLRDAGAKEVHIRIASPPLKYPCYMGINIPTREELVANKMDSAELAAHVGELTHVSRVTLPCQVSAHKVSLWRRTSSAASTPDSIPLIIYCCLLTLSRIYL